MKKLLVLFALVAGFAFSQDSTDQQQQPSGKSATGGNINETDMTKPGDIGADSAQQALVEISLDKFENPSMWKAYMPPSYGKVSLRELVGSPEGKQPIDQESGAGVTEQDVSTLGLKISFLKRGYTKIDFTAVRPIYVPGITKNISVWVVGRNYEHQLRLIVDDLSGHRFSLPMGKLNFSGWKKMTVTIPENVKQQERHYNDTTGLKVVGFEIIPDVKDTRGDYFVYFDDLRATTDMFLDYARDPDDMIDNW